MRRHRAHRRRRAAVPRSGDNRCDTDTDADAHAHALINPDSDSPVVSLGEAAGVYRAVRSPGPVTRALTVVITGTGRPRPGPDGLPATGGHARFNPRSHRAGLDAHAHAHFHSHPHSHSQSHSHLGLHRHAIRPTDVDTDADSPADRHSDPDPDPDGTIHAGADTHFPTDRHPHAAVGPASPDRCDRGTDIRHPALALCPHAGLSAAGTADSR